MSYSFNLYSHRYNSKNYKLLYEHLKNVGEIAKKIVLDKQIKDKKILAEIAYLIGISHDFAKSTTYFQNYLKKGQKTEKAFHGKLSSIFSYYVVKNYIELKNIKTINNFLPTIAWLVVMKHHSDINDLMGTEGEIEKLNDLEIEKEQIEDIKQNHLNELSIIYDKLSPFKLNLNNFFNNFDDICKQIKEDSEELVFKQELGNYFIILFLYSVLLDADKLDASEINFEKIKKEREEWTIIPENLVDNYKKIEFHKESEINRVRNESYDEVISNLKKINDENNLSKNRIFSIELPTGFGKTLTPFSFALKLREIVRERLCFSPRIIYSLPFLSIIDQNSEVISKVLEKWLSSEKKLSEIPSSLLLKHHHLADISYKTKEKDEELEIDPEKSLLLIEGWHSEIIITTFVQFFHSLITNKNRAARKFHNIVNSIIILDEIQSIPYEYWTLVRDSLIHLAYNYNCWIILMTATQPLIFRKNEIIPLVKNKEKYFKKFNRIKYLTEINEKEFNEFKNEILNHILKTKKNFAIIVNTIDASKELYKFLKNELKQKYNEFKVTDKGILEFKEFLLINLSTHVLPIYRIERIKEINKVKNKRKIIVTTQLIEAGVDISVDVIYRDLAPFDCIIQAGGRCNRNNERKKGICKIYYLTNKNREFCRIYDSTLLNITKEILNEKKYFEEKDVSSLIQKYFKKVLEKGSNKESEDNLEAMKLLFFSKIDNFKLIKDVRPKIDVFVDINKKSQEIWKKYNEINEIKERFKRRNEFLRIKNEFYNYVIQIDKNDAKHYLIDQYIGYIKEENYDIETGFKNSGIELIW